VSRVVIGTDKHGGRGATVNPDPRYLDCGREYVDDGWNENDEELEPLRTQVTIERARTILTRNNSPDVPFEVSINPYRGCEHGCVYCYARPAHAYMDLSPGLDFESKLFAKPDAAKLLANELAARDYLCSPVALGANTDPYQPIERDLKITRAILEQLAACKHPFTVVTKSALVERDIDLIAPMAEQGLAMVHISITTLDRALARTMEPRAAAPSRRLQTVKRLRKAGVPVGVLFAPVIPALNDHELESILAAAAESDAGYAAYILLRLPQELKPIFTDWLQTRYALKAAHVLSRIRAMRSGKLSDPNFQTRHSGSGDLARLLEQRFRLSCQNLGLNRERARLDTSQFVAPHAANAQADLFDQV